VAVKSILVTGIGGGVGQGILRNLRALGLQNPIIGTNVERVSAGNHLCDAVYEVPFAYDDTYVDSIAQIVDDNDVGLVLPSTDYEVYHLALGRDRLGAPVAASDARVSRFCLDKLANFETFNRHGIEFARSVLPSAYAGEFERVVVKPREGRGSRNIHIDPVDPTAFGEDYVVQEYLDGPELTTAFYVRQDGQLHGSITMSRALEHGNTSSAQVEFAYDAQMDALLRQLVQTFDFRGSANVQSRVVDRGVVPFEINCRISGTNSIRSQLGFADVKYAVQELLLGQEPDAPAVIVGSAIRIMHDVVYPGLALDEIRDRRDEFRIF